jgi:hypothetical protein
VANIRHFAKKIPKLSQLLCREMAKFRQGKKTKKTLPAT